MSRFSSSDNLGQICDFAAAHSYSYLIKCATTVEKPSDHGEKVETESQFSLKVKQENCWSMATCLEKDAYFFGAQKSWRPSYKMTIGFTFLRSQFKIFYLVANMAFIILIYSVLLSKKNGLLNAAR